MGVVDGVGFGSDVGGLDDACIGSGVAVGVGSGVAVGISDGAAAKSAPVEIDGGVESAVKPGILMSESAAPAAAVAKHTNARNAAILSVTFISDQRAKELKRNGFEALVCSVSHLMSCPALT